MSCARTIMIVGPTVFNGYGKTRDGGQKCDLQQTRGGRSESSTRTPSTGFSDSPRNRFSRGAPHAALATEPLGLTQTRTTPHSLVLLTLYHAAAAQSRTKTRSVLPGWPAPTALKYGRPTMGRS